MLENERSSIYKFLITTLMKIPYFIKKSKSKYDRYGCKECGSYMYLSYIYCTKCLKSGCISHMSICICMDNKINLFIRYTQQVKKRSVLKDPKNIEIRKWKGEEGEGWEASSRPENNSGNKGGM